MRSLRPVSRHPLRDASPAASLSRWSWRWSLRRCGGSRWLAPFGCHLEIGAAQGAYAFTGREWDPETGLYYYRTLLHYYGPSTAARKKESIHSFGYLYRCSSLSARRTSLGWATTMMLGKRSWLESLCKRAYQLSGRAGAQKVHGDPTDLAPTWHMRKADCSSNTVTV
jgi:hypothetical protein